MNPKLKKMKTLTEDKLMIYRPKDLISSLLQQNYKTLSKEKDKFEDSLFPPNEFSIHSGYSKPKEEVKVAEVPSFIKKQLSQEKTAPMVDIRDNLNNYVWKRLSDIYNIKEINICKEPIQINDTPDIMTEDVVQGDLGDCYFLSVLSALAEKPNRIHSLFQYQNLSPNGIFECKVVIHGNLVPVVIDDYFPCKEVSQGVFKPAFAGINEKTNNIWPMLLEKVWAKVNINYDNIISGVPSEAFSFLSPAPYEIFYHEKTHDILFEKIKKADQADYIICCSITQSDTSVNLDYLSKVGLISNHAYTVIGQFEISDLDGNRVKLLKIRNPWGNNEWSGDWSDNSKKWTPELMKKLNFKSGNDGTFYMKYEDYLKFYTTTYISKIHDNYFFQNQTFEYNISQAHNLVKVNVKSNGHGFFIFNQKSQRIYRLSKNNPKYENKFCSIIVFKKDTAFTYVGAMSGRGDRLYVEANLTPGTYVISVFFPFEMDNNAITEDLDQIRKNFSEKISNSAEIITYIIGIYSNIKDLEVVQVPQEDFHEYNDCLRQVLVNRADEQHECYVLKEQGEEEAWRSIAFEDDNGLICYNNGSDGYILERITFTTLYGINLIPMFEKKDLSYHDDFFEEVEDYYEREAMKKFYKEQSNSSVKLVKKGQKGVPVSEENPYVIDVKIAPLTESLILLQKYDSNAGIDIDSKILIIYPLNILLSEKKGKIKKTRVKYNQKLIDVYETIIEHNGGILFKYKNKTKEFKFTVHVKFINLNNLLLKKHGENNEEPFTDNDLSIISNKKSPHNIVVDEYKSVDPAEVNIDIEDETKEVIISLEPGETGFFELSVIEPFEGFSYENDTNYYINLSRQIAKKSYGYKDF